MKAMIIISAVAVLISSRVATAGDPGQTLPHIPVVKLGEEPPPQPESADLAADLAAGDADAGGDAGGEAVEEPGEPWTVAAAVVGSAVGVTALMALVAFVVLPRHRASGRAAEEAGDDGADFIRSLRGHQSFTLHRVRGYEEVIPAPHLTRGPRPQSEASLRTALGWTAGEGEGGAGTGTGTGTGTNTAATFTNPTCSSLTRATTSDHTATTAGLASASTNLTTTEITIPV